MVNIYLDGTIQVSSGGTEMGQGLFTKMSQLVADSFSLPIESVRVTATSTEKNHNTSPTAASASTDLNGTAVPAPATSSRSGSPWLRRGILQRPIPCPRRWKRLP